MKKLTPLIVAVSAILAVSVITAPVMGQSTQRVTQGSEAAELRDLLIAAGQLRDKQKKRTSFSDQEVQPPHGACSDQIADRIAQITSVLGGDSAGAVSSQEVARVTAQLIEEAARALPTDKQLKLEELLRTLYQRANWKVFSLTEELKKRSHSDRFNETLRNEQARSLEAWSITRANLENLIYLRSRLVLVKQRQASQRIRKLEQQQIRQIRRLQASTDKVSDQVRTDQEVYESYGFESFSAALKAVAKGKKDRKKIPFADQAAIRRYIGKTLSGGYHSGVSGGYRRR